jgi:hypothetical protein
MCIGRFYLNAVVTSTGYDEQVICWHPFARFAAAICQLACRLPHFIIDRQFYNPLLVIQQRSAFSFAAYACP